MHRFFISDNLEEVEKFNIYGDEANHIKNVLRLKFSDEIIVCNGKENEYVCKIIAIEKDSILVDKLYCVKNTAESKLSITLFQGIPKSDKMELIIQKATELGVKRIVPTFTERTIVKLRDNKDIERKMQRWQRIALEASKQSRRSFVPEITTPMEFKDAILLACDSDLSIIPFVKEKKNGLKNILKSKHINSVSIFIGPEGGYSSEEMELARNENIQPISLGPRILRSETAGLTVISILMYEIGDIG